MNRRSFMSSILALGVAPAIVRADSLMRIVPRETLILPTLDLHISGRSNLLCSIVGDILNRSGFDPSMYDLSALDQPITGFIMDPSRTISETLTDVCRVSNTEAWQDYDGMLRFKKRA